MNVETSIKEWYNPFLASAVKFCVKRRNFSLNMKTGVFFFLFQNQILYCQHEIFANVTGSGSGSFDVQFWDIFFKIFHAFYTSEVKRI